MLLVRLGAAVLASGLGTLSVYQAPEPVAAPVAQPAPPLPPPLEVPVSQYPIEYDPFYTPPIAAEPAPRVRRVWARVTACSPHDSEADKAYYKKYGYQGEVYNIAADPRQFPIGTKIRIPGYMDKSYPGKFWTVDSTGGPIIRRSVERGIYHIDVKFQTLHSVKQWGSQWLQIEILVP